ncbi:MAG: serine/threonine-protein kinase, partial [Chloroflexota bacterium]
MNLQPGQHIGKYIIEERIGSGGMAVVYRARHKQLQKDVALKMMHESIADDPDLLQRFLREAQIVSRLSHPNIVGLFDYDAENNQSFLVMQYINGRALKWHLRKRVLPLAEINTICTAIANALTYAHENDVLHRDVKPGNVIIAEDGTPFLTDFGLARVVSQGESSLSAGMIVGTPHYLSPEQASGEYEIGPAADIYALGVMLYEMVVGRVPFAAETPHAIVHDQIYTAPPRPTLVNPEIPADVEDVLMRVLEKDPSERYTTANDLMDAFNLAIQQSGLLELSEDRREIAAQSMAKLR